MSEEILNRELLPGNGCFGCGHENPSGLKIEVIRDPVSPDRLAGRFTPPEHASGFPGVTHGGALFTAMDCLATWVVVLLGPTDERYWVLGNADVSYRRPTHPGQRLRLSGGLVERDSDDDSEAVTVHVTVETPDDELAVEGDFREVPVPPEKFRHMTGIEQIPEAWTTLFERAEGEGER